MFFFVFSFFFLGGTLNSEILAKALHCDASGFEGGKTFKRDSKNAVNAATTNHSQT